MVVNLSDGMPASNYRRCSRCGKVLKSRVGCDQHIRDAHGGGGRRIPVMNKRHPEHPEHEPSMAELVIEARLNHLSGEPVPDWLGDMFPEDIYDD